MTDLTLLTDTELTEQLLAVSREMERRRLLASIPARMESLTRSYLTAEGVEQGQGWRQPVAAFDAYPEGWQVQHGGKAWESLTPANVWTPGLSGWREVTPEGAGPTEWVQPTGAHDSYPVAAKVTYNGKTWTSTAANNVWKPGEYGWTEFTTEGTP